MRRFVALALAAALVPVMTGCCGPQVPDVKGLTLDQASAKLRTAGFTVAPPSYDESAVGAPGAVIAQDPAGGTRSQKGARVVLTVAGAAPVAIPRVVGLSCNEASATLRAVGLTLGTVAYSYEESVPSGQVVSQEPTAGTQATKGSAVSIVVSKGARPLDVPDVVGRTEGAARRTLEDAGLKVGIDTAHSTAPKGRVIGQSPRRGTVAPGSKITITVSEGAALVTVPRVLGKDAGYAASVLRSAGLRVRSVRTEGAVESGADAYGPGQVYRQTPHAGARVPKGTPVTIRSYLEPGI